MKYTIHLMMSRHLNHVALSTPHVL